MSRSSYLGSGLGRPLLGSRQPARYAFRPATSPLIARSITSLIVMARSSPAGEKNVVNLPVDHHSRPGGRQSGQITCATNTGQILCSLHPLKIPLDRPVAALYLG